MPVSSPQTLRVDLDELLAPVAALEPYMTAFLRDRAMPGNLRSAIEYALLGGGKRLRPTLALHACRAVGGIFEQAYAPATAVEMIHAFSLVHDDLPAMDDDDLRRGRPTLHRYAGEAMAILAGDAMTSLAVELLADRIEPDELSCRLIRELAKATTDMISGQVHDTIPDFDQATPPHERLLTIHRHKTGALLLAACRMGAICGGADADQLEAITQYAQATGLMFQIVDDLLDVTQSTQQLGKAAGKDAQQGKMTYPGLLGIDASRAEVDRLCGEALEAIEPLGESAEPLAQLCRYMAVREK